MQPLALTRGGRGADDPLHVTGGDVLAADRRDDRGREPPAQPPLGISVPPGPPLGHREPAGVQVVRDQVRAGPFHVRRPGPQPLGDLLQLGGQLRLGHGLPVPPPPVLGEHRPSRLPRVLRRVHRDPALHLHHHTGGITDGLAGIPADTGLAAPAPARLALCRARTRTMALSWYFLSSSGRSPVLVDQAVDDLPACDPAGHVDRLAGFM